MVELFPKTYNKFVCPECKKVDIKINEIIFPGLHIIADCICLNCKFEFLQDMPTAHSLYYPVILGKNNKHLYGKELSRWFHKAFLHSYLNQSQKDIRFVKKQMKVAHEVIILNCIDYLYGHVLLKLFNAQYYIDNFPDIGLIILIPQNFAWLVPEGTAEVWTVDLNLSQARDWYNSLNNTIHKEFKRFDKVYLSLAFPHPDFAKIDITKFTGIKRFNISEFDKSKPIITFIYREDRLWLSSSFGNFLFLIIKDYKFFALFKLLLISRQNRRINKLFKVLNKMIPGATFYLAGLGKKRKCASFINDLREEKITNETELTWCKLYSHSHLVIGVHGSNMLLPTALSAGFIEILPASRYVNIMQDISAIYEGPLYLFLCRFAPGNPSVKTVSNLATSIVKHYRGFYLMNSKEFKQHKLYEDVNDLWGNYLKE
jgi:hypothetical protein